MIKISHTTAKNCLQETNSHGWINKMMGLKIPTTPAMQRGKELHKILQAKILTGDFPLLAGFSVEQKDFDDNMRIKKPINDKFETFGFVDGKRDNDLLEIKTGQKYWSMGDFYNSTQLQLYAFITNAQKMFCLTTLQEENATPKLYQFDITDSFKKKGEKFIMDAIDVLEKGEFHGGLDESGRCSIYCPYGINCFFKS